MTKRKYDSKKNTICELYARNADRDKERATQKLLMVTIGK